MESFNDLYRSITGRITAEALKERVMNVLQVWADWFLFSDAYVNGLRATFLRTGSSGVVPFHSICGDVPELEKKNCSDVTGDGGKANQDAALAMGKGAAMKELLSLPLAGLERRCRHNGLSLVGGRETMVARLLYLEDAEKQRGFELNDDMKYVQNHPHSGKYPSGQKDNKVEIEPPGLPVWNRENEFHGLGSQSLTQGILVRETELKPISNKGITDPVLPASKWAREDDESDDEQKGNARDLGLGYSSSGSENAVGSLNGTEERERATDASIPAYPDSGLNEEDRQKLRRLEVALMEYRESLEERGVNDAEEIDRKVAIHRKRLQSEYGLLDSQEDGAGSKRLCSERRERR